ncbi:MAG TPA: hypothetical protein VGD08_26390 [Stellaceae bacterium]
MTLRTEFSLINSEFNGFLFAPIGEEESGIQLTVLSALSRLALDPWGEAARLSSLPKETAAPALAAMIARLPTGRWEPSDVRAIAARLVQLLPERAPASSPGRIAGAAGEKTNVTAALWLVILVLCAGFIGMQFFRTGQAPDPAASTSSSPQQEQNRP